MWPSPGVNSSTSLWEEPCPCGTACRRALLAGNVATVAVVEGLDTVLQEGLLLLLLVLVGLLVGLMVGLLLGLMAVFAASVMDIQLFRLAMHAS